MAGIGFVLKRLFRDEEYTNRTKAYLYSALVAAGPWIAAVITVNLLIFIMDYSIKDLAEKELFMGTIVYSFIFSQILTAPWQMIITRYIADKLYSKEYAAIRPSFIGLSQITFVLSLAISVIFYYDKNLPLYYKVMAIYLFNIISLIWVLMVYLSAVKDYELIAKAYIYGGIISTLLTWFFIYNPLPFSKYMYASNLLFAYLIGISVTFIMLMYTLLSTFYFGNRRIFDFLRYLSKFPSLFYIGLFYTAGLWADDILMWFSIASVEVADTYLYAPVYDNAMFLAYLTIIPAMVLFLVSVETEFYDYYKAYYGLANNLGTLAEIEQARQEMRTTIYRQLIQAFEKQGLFSITIILLAPPIFRMLNYSIIIRDIFRVATLATLFNIFILLIILVLLYFEVRLQALLIAFAFFITNIIFTYYFSNKGLEYYGYGFCLSSFLAFLIAGYALITFMRKLNYTTFALQPLFLEEEKGVFVRIADWLNLLYEKKAK